METDEDRLVDLMIKYGEQREGAITRFLPSSLPGAGGEAHTLSG